MDRVLTRLSMVVIECDGQQGGVSYPLLWNKHLGGYNFFGGHIDDGEDPAGAALRELKEEVGEEELKIRWGLDFPDDVPDEEWKHIANDIKPLAGDHGTESCLPFYSVRAQREGLPAEKNAELYFFKLRLKKDSALFRRLSRLSDMISERTADRPVCRFFSNSELIEQGWGNHDNPFIRFAAKKYYLGVKPEQLTTPPYEFNASGFEAALEKHLKTCLTGLLGLQDGGHALDVHLIPPPVGSIEQSARCNFSLRASLELRWSGSALPLRLTFPYPVHGVFALHSDNCSQGGLWTWHPRLVTQPGFWIIKKYHSDGKSSRWLRLGLVGRNYVEAALENVKGKRVEFAVSRKLPSFLVLPAALGLNTEICGGRNFIASRKDANALLEEMKEYAGSCLDIPDAQVYDDQDLRYQRLLTYPAFLIDQLVRTLIKHILSNEIKGYLSQPDTVTESLRQEIWNFLCENSKSIEWGMLPLNELRKNGWFHLFAPINGLAAISQLNSFQKFDYGGQSLDLLSAIYRQNHPSYRGVVCPVETPESKRVGITLNLAAGVETDILGRFVKTNVIGDWRELGYAASLVPFYQHNDGPRSMMGAKNLKQAVAVQGASPPAVRTGTETAVQHLVDQLAESGIALASSGAFPGVDLLVAYMPWYGWNYEDAIVVNRRLVEQEVLDWVTEVEYSEYIKPGYELCEPQFDSPLQNALAKIFFDSTTWLRKQHSLVIRSSEIAFFKNPDSDDIYAIRCGGEGNGELAEIGFSKPPSGFLGGRLHWKVRYRLPLGVGDKLMGRHGNKGVVSVLLPPEEMPRLPDDPLLPETLRGRAVDLVLNPNGVISRMNLGQLIETHIGLLHYAGAGTNIPANCGEAFKGLDFSAVRDAFGKLAPAVDQHGRVFLTLPDGRKTESPVTIGFQHIVRLKHTPSHKAQLRKHKGGPYSVITGQPVGGRKNKGGQRVGEMEVWALAAHQADENLAAMLGYKSDLSCGNGELENQTFDAIKSHLFALGALAEPVENGYRFRWAKLDDIESRGKPVLSNGTWCNGMEGHYYCDNPGCNYQYRQSVGTGVSERSPDVALTVGDVLAAHGYRVPPEGKMEVIHAPGKKEQEELDYSVNLDSFREQGREKTIELRFKVKTRSIALAFVLGGKTFRAYRQIDKKFDLNEFPLMKICCPRHTTNFLRCERSHPIPIAISGGLCDPDIFGNIEIGEGRHEAWGYIESLSKDKMPIPVLPLKYRYRKPDIGGNGRVERKDLTSLYAKVFEASKNGWDFDGACQNLFTAIQKTLFGKNGLIRRHGLGRRVDYSGRFVIVPDPTMKWDECGVPTAALIGLMGEKIANWPELLNHFSPDELTNKLIAAVLGAKHADPEVSDEVRKAMGTSAFWENFDLADASFGLDFIRLAQQVVAAYMDEHPDITVILNRQPSLHRYNIMAFRPIPLPPEDGMVLRIHPLVCKGFAADFDGDEMALHFPLTDAEQEEAQRLKPTAKWNLLSLANKTPVAGFDQDFVLGHYLMSQRQEGREYLRSMLPVDSCADCDQFLKANTPWDKKHGAQLLAHLCEAHHVNCADWVVKWMREAFKTATEQGVSFGYLELEACRQSRHELDSLPSAPSEFNNMANTLTREHLVEKASMPDLSDPAVGFAKITVSGARGGEEQTRQLVTARGVLSPGEAGFGFDIRQFLIRETLYDGMSPESAFWAAMNTRSSMIDKKLGTPKAGYITRRLVLACWSWRITSEDCGNSHEPRNLLTCKHAENGMVCSKCYGEIQGYDSIPDGFPIGLIAAQSFGERGTQLSMQSFHTGKRALSVNGVEKLLNGNDPVHDNKNWFGDAGDAEGFVARIRTEDAYHNLDERQLLLIWLIIHHAGNDKVAGTLGRAAEVYASPFALLCGSRQRQYLLDCLDHPRVDDMNSPFAKILVGNQNLSSGAIPK